MTIRKSALRPFGDSVASGRSPLLGRRSHSSGPARWDTTCRSAVSGRRHALAASASRAIHRYRARGIRGSGRGVGAALAVLLACLCLPAQARPDATQSDVDRLDAMGLLYEVTIASVGDATIDAAVERASMLVALHHARCWCVGETSMPSSEVACT
ncbi:MAG: hypothetical protein LJE69_15340 [Thiohalocapsa sp.]|uniref:hypothetical protein n=1 Tax=Thiohalocapsa sp. TaxID=2497641 RepID=UPI0025E38A84|nr:hypothetical protein [Thiohalocapsa sp.]MCG6942613.1 hypothetical protein [Thiohalocapsa sp.]